MNLVERIKKYGNEIESLCRQMDNLYLQYEDENDERLQEKLEPLRKKLYELRGE